MPGTVLRREGENNWIIACRAEWSRPDNIAPILATRTSDFSVNINDRNSLRGNVFMLNVAEASTHLENQATTTVTIANTKMLHIDDAALQGGTVQNQCREHLSFKAPSSDLRKLSVIMEALQADIIVDISFDRGGTVSAHAKNQLVDHMASQLQLANSIGGHLKVNTKSNGDATLTGEGIVWAIKDDERSLEYFLRGLGLLPRERRIIQSDDPTP